MRTKSMVLFEKNTMCVANILGMSDKDRNLSK